MPANVYAALNVVFEISYSIDAARHRQQLERKEEKERDPVAGQVNCSDERERKTRVPELKGEKGVHRKNKTQHQSDRIQQIDGAIQLSIMALHCRQRHCRDVNDQAKNEEPDHRKLTLAGDCRSISLFFPQAGALAAA